MSADVEDEQVAALIAQRLEHTGAGCGFADYEIRALTPGQGGFEEHAAYALGFRYEHFGLQDIQAVSCDVCGGIFRDGLRFMKRHRLVCGW